MSTRPAHEDAEAPQRHDDLTRRTARALFGVGTGIANTVYGTVVVMATLTATYSSERDPGKLAGIVAATAFVLWIAHVYAHSLGHAITHSRPTLGGLLSIAGREIGIVLAAVPPMVALLLGAAGILRESRAVWLALALGLATLAAEGIRYARLEELGRAGTLAVVGLNVGLGLLVVALKVLVAH